MFNFLKKDQLSESEIYFGLVLKENEGIGMILKVDKRSKRLSVIKEHKIAFTDGWERLTEDVDQTLYELEKVTKTQTKKIIFFLYSHLIDQKSKKIEKPYLDKIKKITENLDLKAVGFIEYHEAIALYLEKKEEAPLTSIIIELDKPVITLFVYKGGELFFSESIAKTENLVSDMEILMSKINGEIILPSRIILYDSTRLISESEKIMAHKWDERLFIQIPRVEIMSADHLLQALIEAFSAQVFDDAQIEEVLEKDDSDLMGFIVSQDINDIKNAPQTKTIVEPSNPMIAPPNIILDSIAKRIKGVVINLKSMSGRLGQKKIYLLMSIAVIGIMIVLFCSSLYFFHTGSVTLFFDEVSEAKEFRIKGHLTNSGIVEGISIEEQSKTVEISDNIDTSGEKIIGEKASGIVAVYNKEKNEKTLKKGSVLVSTNGIKFALDDDIKVASASESLTSEGNILTVTGKNKVQITAADIGSKANLKKGEKLKIEDFSENIVFALVETDLTGGSEKSIKTVSKDDIAKLKEKINKKAVTENKISTPQDVNKKIINSLTSVTSILDTYSHEVGEEANSISLKTKVKLVFYVFNEEDLKKVIVNSLKSSISDDYEIISTNLAYSITSAKKEEGRFTFYLKTTAKLAKKIDKERLIESLLGTSVEESKSRLKENQKIKKIDINIQSPIPILQSRMPFFKEHIKISVKSI
ncbi:hypothetical protein A3C23_05535 [Candidatus Roizmanbacteria bacterium RIFCSPHIGHO2_02_FULL_37_13b]|uniref:Uncharacterized protein n=1 Tax=Candidatus Roizmanbacteria bacterium RIFCSPLOWO2_02_FULL_36_11 TaxID=1802071 RepID=A0A1F7JCF9_9BACT|nr:MAG: hypothetical protein A3C23_05535 [Candidatus Roizmanbacteria bacterium RIFCSPHIGHO2_02_FULL_37_13b]OGK53296.1 MAG: hypothetical protein A3H78_03255 [Candidatus Roizmanbacteria bacterium RIFCSPLOWO2_02_FULL_36_11]